MQQTHPNQMGNPMYQQQPQTHQFNPPNINSNQHMGMHNNMPGNINQGFQNYNGPPINNNMQLHN